MTDPREPRVALRALSNVTELHPEELFDKQDAGELSPAEAEELARHLERCAACRVERAARGEFRVQLAMDTGPLDLILGGALGALAGTAPNTLDRLRHLDPHGIASTLDGVSDNPARVATRRPVGRRTRSTSLVVAALLLAGAAAAWQLTLGMAQHSGSPRGTTAAAPQRATPGPAGRSSSSSSLGSAAGAASADPVNAEIPTASVAASTHTGQEGAASRLAATPSAPTAASVRPSAPTSAPAAELFAAANQARSAGRANQALQRYAELVRRFPKSPEARAARALSAQLALDTGSPDQALAEYDSYLDAAPLLTEEALVGRARALSRMPDRAAERSAWLELLRRYPDAAARKEAEQRLASAGGR